MGGSQLQFTAFTEKEPLLYMKKITVNLCVLSLLCWIITVVSLQGTITEHLPHCTAQHTGCFRQSCAEQKCKHERYPCQAVKWMWSVFIIKLNEFHLIWQNMSGGVLGWGNANSSVMIWKKKKESFNCMESNIQQANAVWLYLIGLCPGLCTWLQRPEISYGNSRTDWKNDLACCLDVRVTTMPMKTV